ncbi:MAG: hypothetical protein KF836_07915 [Fimbriimonadaceae bacterium]|nr:hypothetical protein [Fimbriimonadaceae bacterium]
MPTSTWNIRLFGGFRIETPEGDEIEIPSRKGKALVALLALQDGIAVSRELLGQELWPDKPKLSQQQNLRQAVTQVKVALAPWNGLEATRETCRLTFTYYCDALECLTSGKDPGKELLLPEMPEPVFESYRSEFASNAPLGDEGEAARGAARLLEWTLMHDPKRCLDLLHSCRELIPSMPLPLLENALRLSLNEVSENDPIHLWGRSQFAVVLMWAGHWEEGIKVARQALSSVEPGQDPSEWTAAAHTAAIFLIFRGRFDKAEHLISNAIEIAETHGLVNAINRFNHARALKLGYQGEYSQAVKILETLQPSAIICAHISTYYAAMGDAAQAREYLARAKDIQPSQLDLRLACQFGLAECSVLAIEGQIDSAKGLVLEMLKLCEDTGMHLPMIHALEGLAVVETNAEIRHERLARALSLRSRHRFPLLPGDKIRLKNLLPEIAQIAGITEAQI